MSDLFHLAGGGKINPTWDGRRGAGFYAEDKDLGSVMIDMTLGEVEALRDRMAEIARQIHEANPITTEFTVTLPEKPRKR
jgi:hypothetical protein